MQYRKDIDLAYELIGREKFYRSKEEMQNRKFRRSIYISKKILKGERFSKNNLKKVRPGGGVNPVYYEEIIGKKSYKNFYAGKAFTHKDLKKLKIKRKYIF